MVDPTALTAEALAIRAEELHRKRLLEREVALARWQPLLILGIRQAWPIAPEPDGTCPVCRGRMLSRVTMCLWCNRSGVDVLLDPPPKATVRHAYKPGRLAGGKEERTRGEAGQG